MAFGKSVQLRNIFSGYGSFISPRYGEYRNPDRAERKAGQLAARRAAKARAAANGHGARG